MVMRGVLAIYYAFNQLSPSILSISLHYDQQFGLEAEMLVRRETKLLEGRKHRKLEHRWWATHENLRVRRGRWQMRFDHLSVHEAGRVLPLWAGVAVDRVPNMHVQMVARHGVDLLAAQNVLFGLVRKEDVELGLVVGVLQRTADHLEHGRDTRATSNHTDLLGTTHFWLWVLNAVLNVDLALAHVRQLALWSGHFDGVADLKALEVLGHLAAIRELWMHVLEVDLDDEVDVALGVIRAHWRVRAHHKLAFLVRVAQRDVLTHRQAQHVPLARQPKAEAPRVVRQLLLLNERQVHRRRQVALARRWLERLRRPAFHPVDEQVRDPRRHGHHRAQDHEHAWLVLDIRHHRLNSLHGSQQVHK